MEKRRHIYWTHYATHCVDLMIKDVGKLKIHQNTFIKTKQIVKFIYEHTWVLDLMRTFTKKQEYLRPTITQFATSFFNSSKH